MTNRTAPADLPALPKIEGFGGTHPHDLRRMLRNYGRKCVKTARRQALEEAALACEARIGTCEPGLEGDIEDVDSEAQLCADAIRALIPKP